MLRATGLPWPGWPGCGSYRRAVKAAIKPIGTRRRAGVVQGALAHAVLVHPVAHTNAPPTHQQRTTIATATVPPPAAQGRAIVLALTVPSCHLQFGEHLRAVGSCAELGAWDPLAAPALDWTEGDTWCARVALPPGQHAFKLVKVGIGGQVEWEAGSDRLLEVLDLASSTLLVHAAFGDSSSTMAELQLHDEEPEVHRQPAEMQRAEAQPAGLETPAGSHEHLAQQAAKVAAIQPAAEGGAVKVALTVPSCHLQFGEHLRAVGSCAELGAWNLHAAPALDWGKGDTWTASVALPPGQHAFKLVKVLLGGQVEWEAGSDRLLNVPQLVAGSIGGGLSVRSVFGDTSSTAAGVVEVREEAEDEVLIEEGQGPSGARGEQLAEHQVDLVKAASAAVHDPNAAAVKPQVAERELALAGPASVSAAPGVRRSASVFGQANSRGPSCANGTEQLHSGGLMALARHGSPLVPPPRSTDGSKYISGSMLLSAWEDDAESEEAAWEEIIRLRDAYVAAVRHGGYSAARQAAAAGRAAAEPGKVRTAPAAATNKASAAEHTAARNGGETPAQPGEAVADPTLPAPGMVNARIALFEALARGESAAPPAAGPAPEHEWRAEASSALPLAGATAPAPAADTASASTRLEAMPGVVVEVARDASIVYHFKTDRPTAAELAERQLLVAFAPETAAALRRRLANGASLSNTDGQPWPASQEAGRNGISNGVNGSGSPTLARSSLRQTIDFAALRGGGGESPVDPQQEEGDSSSAGLPPGEPAAQPGVPAPATVPEVPLGGISAGATGPSPSPPAASAAAWNAASTKRVPAERDVTLKGSLPGVAITAAGYQIYMLASTLWSVGRSVVPDRAKRPADVAFWGLVVLIFLLVVHD